MNSILRHVHIIDPQSPFHDQKLDVCIQKGKISAIGKSLPLENAKEIMADGSYLFPGLLDLNCTIGEPGFETKETLASAAAAAAAGGFTAITCLPHTQPILQSRSEIKYIINAAEGFLTQILPVGALSADLQGKELTEMFDMKAAGAVAFSNGNKPVTDDGLMYRVLQYAKGVDTVVMSFPENKAISGGALVQESEMSTYLGMKGAPAIAEEMQIMRDIYLAQYHDAKVHISSISTAASVSIIKQAKKNGVKITCDVALHNLIYTEKDLTEFDSNYKFSPVLRTKSDVKALIQGLKDGIIDSIVTQHTPHEVEFKNVEFQIAKPGSIALQTAVAQLLKAGLTITLIVEKMAIQNRNILQLPVPSIQVGQEANCVVYDPNHQWVLNTEQNLSLSKNTPLFQQTITGKTKWICRNQQFIKY